MGRIAAAMSLLAALVLVGAPPRPAAAQDVAGSAEPAVLYLFWAEGCPHCAAEEAWLEGLRDRHPELEVRAYEVSTSAANRELWFVMSRARGTEPSGVPTTIVGEQVWVGFEEVRTAPMIEAAVSEAIADAGPPSPVEPAAPGTVISVPLLGDIDVGSRSLVVSTLLIGFVDGVNPCSLWVLSLLLALVLHTGSRRRVLVVGTTFLVVTTALYGVYIVGLYSVLSYLAYVTWIRVAVASIAAVFGALAIKDFFALGTGPSLSIPASRKPGMIRRMRKVALADRPLPAVVAGTAAMAVGVSLVETPCTAGFPVVWTNLLSSHGVGGAGAAALFGLYMLAFLVDELAIFGAAVVTMRALKLQERHGQILKLVGGVVLLTLAGVMVVAPGLLESVAGTAVVFGVAAAVTSLVAWRYRPRSVRPSGRSRTKAATHAR